MIAWLTLGALTANANGVKRPTDMERGKELYERHCTSCHGPTAAGDGPAATALVHPVPDLSGTVEASDVMVNIVLFGAGFMPGFEASFERPDARRVLKYMAAAHKKGKPKAPEPEPE